MKCKFCGCGDRNACQIPMRVMDDQEMIALAGQVSTFTAACGWVAENICSAPACIEQAYIEASALVTAWDLEAA